MMKKCFMLLAALLAACFVARAQVDLEAEFFSLPDTVTNEYLDSLTIQVQKPNNYLIVGVYGGAALNKGSFNPMRATAWLPNYPMLGFSLTRYFSMFGIFPNMGYEVGAQLNYEGYEFKENKESGFRPTESGAYKATMKVPEAFMLSHFHYDIGEHFKLMAKVGFFVGYRTEIQRVLDEPFIGSDYEAYVNAFRDYDYRWSYGAQFGAGMALMFSPVEFHLNAQFKWGWGSFWRPDYNSPYYYRFGYPMDLGITFGVYYQLTPRYGHTRSQLRRLARKMVQEQQQ